MPKIDADFLRNVQEHYDDGGGKWCEEHDVRWLDLCAHASMTASVAATEDVGLASYGVAMFKLGYEVRRAQMDIEQPLQRLDRFLAGAEGKGKRR